MRPSAGGRAMEHPQANGHVTEPTSLLRDFQREVLELVREQNVVVVGSTGIGKTFVAIALLAEQDYAGGKRAVFMAPTRQLVLQIAAKIKQLSTLACRAYYGQEVELWDEQQWVRELRSTRVLVCTPEIVRNVVEKGYVRMDRINLLVFDECHHVTKRHPYAQLMKMYDATNPAAMPRLFGATACPTNGCADALHATLKKIELDDAQMAQFAAAAPVVFELYNKASVDSIGRNDAAAMPADDAKTIAPADTDEADGTNAIPLDMPPDDARICAVLQAELAELKALEVVDKLLKKSRSRLFTTAAGRAKATTKFARQCFDVYKHLGAWCFYRFVELEVERLARAASLLLAVPGSYYGLDSDAVTTLMRLEAKRIRCAFAVTPKLRLIETLVRTSLLDATDDEAEDDDDGDGDSDSGGSHAAAAFLVSALTRDKTDASDSEMSDDDDDADGNDQHATTPTHRRASLQGIVFIQTRIDCRVVTEYLNEKFAADAKAKSDDESDDDVASSSSASHALADTSQMPRVCGCMLGQGSAMDTASYDLPTFQSTLTDFETGVTRVLVSTAVSVEGVDFPRCGLVVMADRVATSRMFIQLRGRARHEDGVVYYLAEADDLDHAQHFRQLAATANAIHALDFSHDKVPSVLALPRSIAADRLLGHPFTPGETTFVIESTGAKLDLDSSVQVINQFTQTLPPTLFTVDPKHMYTYRDAQHGKTPIFKCTLTLPPELELAPFESDYMLSKAMAKSSVALVAGRTLWERGLLDDALNSVYRKVKGRANQSARSLDFFLDRIHQ